MEKGLINNQLTQSMFDMYHEAKTNSHISCLNESCSYLEVKNIHITPKELTFSNPFEGKLYKVEVCIQNFGDKPALVRILHSSSSAVRIKTNVNPIFLCSGMSIKRIVSYKVQMMTLIESCSIPIYIDEECVEYRIRIVVHPVVLRIKPESGLDFGHLDASDKPIKSMIIIVNDDIKPTRFFFDLGPNDMDLNIQPIRGIITGKTEMEILVSAVFSEKGEFKTNIWLISELAIIISVKALVGVNSIIPHFAPSTSTFTFVQFPSTYYGTSVVRNVIMENNGVSPTFFCVMGEIEMKTYPLKQLRDEVDDYRYFSINPEEGRFLANDVRVFSFTYSPHCKPHSAKQPHHLVMMRVKRTKCKDINPGDYIDNVFEEPEERQSSWNKFEGIRFSSTSALSDQAPYNSRLDIKSSCLTETNIVSPMEVRLMLYGQVEDVSVSVVPDELHLNNLLVNSTTTRVLQLYNNCPALPIIFCYKKIAFVEVKPKMGKIEAQESVEVQILITPKSFTKVCTFLAFDLLYYNKPRIENELVVVGQVKIPFVMDEKIQPPKKKNDSLLAVNFKFKKPNPPPNDLILEKLMEHNVYIGLPDDRPANNLPDPYKRTFKSIYAAIPRYQPKSLACHDKKHFQNRKYYNMYIQNTSKRPKSSQSSVPSLAFSEKCPIRTTLTRAKSTTYTSNEFIPLTPIQVAQVTITPINVQVENVAYGSMHTHTITINNKSNSYLQIFLKGRQDEFSFCNGNRFTVKPSEEKSMSFMLYIGHVPVHMYEVDVIINSSFVCETSVLLKACPKHLSLDVEMLTFYENEPNSKFVELHNELNVSIPFEWKVPSVFKVDPVNGSVAPGRFIACMITFAVGEAENMVYELGVYTDNKYYNLKVLIEGTDYKIKIPKTLPFEELSLNIPCEKSILMQNLSSQRISYEVQDKNLEGFKVKPKDGFIIPWGTAYLTVCAMCNEIGPFNVKLEILVLRHKKVTCEMIGTVSFPDLQFKPEILRFRKMAASSFDIACVTVVNNSNVKAMIQFDTERFPEFSYSEYTNVEYMTNRDFFCVNPNEEKQFSIHFYPYNPLVTSFLLPLLVNKISTSSKSRTVFQGKASVKVHAQVLSYKLEVKSWRYNFTYFPYYDYGSVTDHLITIKNPCKSIVTFCIRLDELVPPFDFKYVDGVTPIYYECSIVVDLLSEESVTFKASYNPKKPGNSTIRLPVYVRDDFTQDMHNYFNFVGYYPESSFKYPDDCIHIGFIPLRFTIMKKVFIDMLYHHPECNCVAILSDARSHLEIDNGKPESTNFRKTITISFNSSTPHFINSKLELACDCPGPDFLIDVYGGSENNYMTVHGCIQYFKLTSNSSVAAMFDINDTDLCTISLVTLNESDHGENIKHTYKCDLPYFQSDSTLFDDYMRQVVVIFEQWLMEQVFFGVKSFSIPDSISVPDIKLYEKQGKPEGIIKVPLQLILNYLLGPSIMASFEIKFSEKKPICVIIRKHYKDILSCLVSYGCYVNMIRPEILLPYEMYTEYMIFMNQKKKTQTQKMYYLLAKQYWLDICMQLYKVFVAKRMLKNLQLVSFGSKINISWSYVSAKDVPGVGQHGLSETIFSEDAVLLLKWVDRNFQENKNKLVAASPGNAMTERLMRKSISNFDDDLVDSLGIIGCLLTCCPFLETYISGIYVPATSRMEQLNNAYILRKILALLRVSFNLQPINIIEPNTVQMLMFLTYLYAFLLPFKYKETIHFEVALSQSKHETITIMNESKLRNMSYNIIFFNNTDNLFEANRDQIVIDVDSKNKLELTYFAKFLRVQHTILLLSGEVPGYNYSNSRVYYLEGKPLVDTPSIPAIELKSTLYKITHVEFEICSPYKESAVYEMFLIDYALDDVAAIMESAIPYVYILKTKTLVRCKFNSAFAEADATGRIGIKADLCSIVKPKHSCLVLFRSGETGDFITKITVVPKPRKQYENLQLTIQKALKKFPCTCPKKKPDVENSKCPRAVKVFIPCRNEALWSSVMEFFLAGRDPEEKEFWDIYGKSQVGVHIVTRILYDHKRYLHDDMTYFMEKKYVFAVRSRRPESVVTQTIKEIVVEQTNMNLTTEISVHFNEIVSSFYLELESTDSKETRTYRVRVDYE